MSNITMTIRGVPVEVVRGLKMEAASRGMTMGALVTKRLGLSYERWSRERPDEAVATSEKPSDRAGAALVARGKVAGMAAAVTTTPKAEADAEECQAPVDEGRYRLNIPYQDDLNRRGR